MNKLFKSLPLAIKLFLIGLIPLVFLSYLTFQVYKEKNSRLKLLEGYIDQINQSANLSGLIDALQTERKLSFDYALGKSEYRELYNHRPKTDTILSKLELSHDSSLYGFKEYTALYRLRELRVDIDSGRIDPDAVMHYYSNTIFRLNTLNYISLPNNSYLQPLYKDLAAQKILTEMITYLGIIRSNIYNVLLTRKFMVETLVGLTGVNDVFKSYEKEFLMKASPGALRSYDSIKAHTDLRTAIQFIDTLFSRFSFDSSLTADQWWSVSNNGINELSRLQQSIWNYVDDQTTALYKKEKADRSQTFTLVIIFLALMIGVITYTIFIITGMLSELKNAARQLARGATDIGIRPVSNDVIGTLTSSIANIAKTNKELAEAADAIGKGNFAVAVSPRSSEDILGNAVMRMKNALQQYSEKMEALVQQRTEELERSNSDLEQFAHVASHDLQEPLRKIKIFTSRLIAEQNHQQSDTGRTYLSKIDQSATRMTKLIEGILNYSSADTASEPFEMVDLNSIVENIRIDLELLIEQKKANIHTEWLPQVEGAPILLNQLFYNLINNALKFSREGVPPEVSITCKKFFPSKPYAASTGTEYEITISDNGIGFEPQYAEHIFNTFSRLHSKNKFEGTGLGLALCMKIVQHHNGKLWAESNGIGASFKMILPQNQG